MLKENDFSRLEINLPNCLENYRYFRNRLKPDTKLLVLVKANAYGHGAVEFAGMMQEAGADYFAVAYPVEGMELKDAGIRIPIMVLTTGTDYFNEIIDYSLEPSIPNMYTLISFCNVLKQRNIENYPIHLKLDTGMHRLGFMTDELPELLDFLMIYPYLKKNAVVVLHDIAYHLNFSLKFGYTCATLFSALKGEKFIPQTLSGNTIPNIGMVHLADLSDDDLLGIFWMLTLYWSYYPNEKQKQRLKPFLLQHYGTQMPQIVNFMFDFRYKEFKSTKFRQIIHILIPEHFRAFILGYLPFLREKKQ